MDWGRLIRWAFVALVVLFGPLLVVRGLDAVVLKATEDPAPADRSIDYYGIHGLTASE